MRNQAQRPKEERGDILIYELCEGIAMNQNLKRMDMELLGASEMGSMAPWDFIYRRGDETFVTNAKTQQNSWDSPFPLTAYNPEWNGVNMIDGHPAKVCVFQDLVDLCMNGMAMRPSMIWFFPKDNIALEYFVDCIGISVSNGQLVPNSSYVVAKSMRSQASTSTKEYEYYPLHPIMAHRRWEVDLTVPKMIHDEYKGRTKHLKSPHRKKLVYLDMLSQYEHLL